MSLKCGIVGLPNVGKSTLFNSLTSSRTAIAANYPFCTIEPNSAIVPIPDKRLSTLASIASSGKIIPGCIEIVDIAGLVQGASKGEGLGNKFLSHIREVDAMLHVLRCFDDANVTHVHGGVNPIYDADIINTELILADLESVDRRLQNISRKLNNGDKTIKSEFELLSDAKKILESGMPARSLLSAYDASTLASLQLLTTKPILYVCNVNESDASTGNKYTDLVAAKAQKEDAQTIIISSKIEEEIAQLPTDEEKIDFLQAIGLSESGLAKVIEAASRLLNLSTYFTIGPKEARAWLFTNGCYAPEAAGIIHTDFEKGFIRAEVIKYEDYIECNGEVRAKELGKMKLEGKEYKVCDGDVMHFRFNV